LTSDKSGGPTSTTERFSNNETPRIGTAGWSIPSVAKDAFEKQGSQLERYSSRFSCAEINSSFYRPHRAETYARWAASVPASFRFAVKVPRAITHEERLYDSRARLKDLSNQIVGLGGKLGPILIQLPPSLEFDVALAKTFLGEFRRQFEGDAVIEPRHPSWFGCDAERLLFAHRLARVAADPARCPGAAAAGGWTGLRYWRLHGSPRMYYTPYGEERLRCMAAGLLPGDWCIFDNTASGAAIHDALFLQNLAEA
jgi:uncharacterized protein YecE (DUF72 family)